MYTVVYVCKMYADIPVVLWKTCSHRLGQVKIVFFHVFYHFGYHFIYHFFSFMFSFIFFIILFFIFYHFLSFFYHFFYHFLSFFYHFFNHFCFQWCKKNPKNKKNAIFLEFFSFFYHFVLSFLLSGGGIDEKWWKMENCNFPRVFSFFFHFFHFFHFFIIFHHFSSFFINSTTGSKNDKKMIKQWKKLEENCNFFIFWKIFAPLEAKMMKKW